MTFALFVIISIHNGWPGFHPWIGKILWSREWQSTPVFLSGEPHGQRLAGYSPRGRKELDTTERLTLHHSTTACLRGTSWPGPPVKDCATLESCVWQVAQHPVPLVCCSPAQKSTFGEAGITDRSDILFVDVTGDIPFHTTHEMTVRRWNEHIPLCEACHSRKYLQELHGLFTLFPRLPPHLWSIKEPSNQPDKMAILRC